MEDCLQNLSRIF